MPPSAPRSDAALAQAAGTGDVRAFAELYDRYAAAVFGYCQRMLRSNHEAADATHEAFVNVLERMRDTRRPITAPRPYLFRAAHNACLRTLQRGRRVEPVGEPAPPSRPRGDDLGEVERIVFTRELQQDVRAAHAELSLRHREILALRDVEELSYDEIARVMGVTPNAAAQLAWRARASLRRRLRRRSFPAIMLHTLECERALGLLELADDAALSPAEDDWLAAHLLRCPRCAANRAVLHEVGATYRSWVPAGAVPLLTVELARRAGEMVGASWGTGSGTAGAGAASAGVHASAAVSVGGAAGVAGGVASVPPAVVATVVGVAVAVGGTAVLSHHGATRVREASAIAARPVPLVRRAVPGRAPLPALPDRTVGASGLSAEPPAPGSQAAPGSPVALGPSAAPAASVAASSAAPGRTDVPAGSPAPAAGSPAQPAATAAAEAAPPQVPQTVATVAGAATGAAGAALGGAAIPPAPVAGGGPLPSVSIGIPSPAQPSPSAAEPASSPVAGAVSTVQSSVRLATTTTASVAGTTPATATIAAIER